MLGVTMSKRKRSKNVVNTFGLLHFVNSCQKKVDVHGLKHFFFARMTFHSMTTNLNGMRKELGNNRLQVVHIMVAFIHEIHSMLMSIVLVMVMMMVVVATMFQS